jgi:Fucose 4-O-acetylase and related acetyltransferases
MEATVGKDSQTIDTALSNTLYVMKALCLLSIICAHTPYPELPNAAAVALFRRFSDTGVFAYFVLAGFFFRHSLQEPGKFFSKKVRYLLIPWFCLGLVTYAVRFKASPVYFAPLEIANWLLGNGTYLWFLSVLLLCEVIFFVIPPGRRRAAAYACLVLTAASVILTTNGALPLTSATAALAFTSYNVYLNIFNWIGMFALGILLRQTGALDHLIKLKGGAGLLLALASALIFSLISLCCDSSRSYWVPFSLVTESAAFILFFLSAAKLQKRHVLVKIGAATLPIYILHMPTLLIFSKLFRTSLLFTAIRPALVIAFVFTALQIGAVIAGKLRIRGLYGIITGVR